MLSLVGKDLRATALYLCVKVPTLGLLVLGALVAGKAYLIVSSVTAAMFVIVAPALDWSVGAESFVHSLPVSRALVVRARYATSLVMGGAWLMATAVVAVLFASTVETRVGTWPSWVAPETALTAVVYVGAFIAISMGCIHRFGMVTGSVVTTLVHAVVAPFGVRYVGPSALLGLQQAVGMAPAVAGVVLATGGIIWLSMTISIHSYERREF